MSTGPRVARLRHLALCDRYCPKLIAWIDLTAPPTPALSIRHQLDSTGRSIRPNAQRTPTWNWEAPRHQQAAAEDQGFRVKSALNSSSALSSPSYGEHDGLGLVGRIADQALLIQPIGDIQWKPFQARRSSCSVSHIRARTASSILSWSIPWRDSAHRGRISVVVAGCVPATGRKEIGGRLLRRPQRVYPAATVVKFCTAVLSRILLELCWWRMKSDTLTLRELAPSRHRRACRPRIRQGQRGRPAPD